ncbi:MAG: N-acetylneuraminate synthase [Hymenobacteraceae bacterium]|nr:N-acetylneuraminate synthase [Hymenobacteraceae bacterium]
MRTLIIAEAGVNHNGNLELARQLIDVAAEAGVDIVKFQTFKAEKLVSKAAQQAAYQTDNLRAGGDEAGAADASQFAMLKKLELDDSAHHALLAHCRARGIRFCSTPFDLESMDELVALGVDLMKIPSGELTNLPYLRKAGAQGLPVIVSTGMATLGEIETALLELEAAGTPRVRVTVLHCNTQYPTPMPDVNLRAMNTIGRAFDVAIGYSDHTLGIEVPIAAVPLGAVCIEKHFTLDRTLPGPDHAASLEPAELRAMVLAIRNIEAALGDGIKRASASEAPNKTVARRSVHLATDRPAGHLLTSADLELKRPGDGLPAALLPTLLGRRLRHALAADHKLSWEDLG